jgi:hypothetical protein
MMMMGTGYFSNGQNRQSIMLYRVWPYQSWSLTVLSSRYIVFDRKSIPIVACSGKNKT